MTSRIATAIRRATTFPADAIDAGLHLHRDRVVGRKRMSVLAVCWLMGSLAAFLIQVDVVVACGSEKQVVCPDASTVIASMEHPESVRNVAMCKGPSNPVRVHQNRAAIDLGHSELAVTNSRDRGGPEPTIGRHVWLAVSGRVIDLIPEAFRHGPRRHNSLYRSV